MSSYSLCVCNAFPLSKYFTTCLLMTFRIESKSTRRIIWSIKPRIVTNADELLDAVKHGDEHITVEGEIRRMPMLALQPGQTLTGGTLHFGFDSGVQLSRNNALSEHHDQ